MTAALHNPHGTAFGLMDEVYGPGTAQALRDSGGPWEYFGRNGWELALETLFLAGLAYRIKPQPPKPREWWAVQTVGTPLHVGMWRDRADAELAASQTKGLTEIIHVVEVLP